MSNPNFIINDSEGESDGAIADGPPAAQFHPAPIVPAQLQEPSAYQTVPTSGGSCPSLPQGQVTEQRLISSRSPTELRKKAIDEAHAALLSTDTPAPPTQSDPSPSKSKVKRRQTAHGRLEGGGVDVYAFNASDDDNFDPSSVTKKRKRPSSEKKPTRTKKKDDDDDISDYEQGAKSSKKKPAKRSKSASLSVLDLLNDSSGDDYTPTSGRKPTRNNTVPTDLLPPLPKPKRKPRESSKPTNYYEPPPPQFDGALSLAFSPSDHSAEIQVVATNEPAFPTPQQFMVDLTKNDLVLPSERRAEYDPVSPELSPTEFPPHIRSTNGVYSTPDLRSTIPDPPYDPILLPSQIGVHLANHYTGDPLAPASIASDSPLSSPENSPAVKPTPARKTPKEKKRAVTDQGDGFGNFPVASEWRAAKGKARQGMAQPLGRSKTLNALGTESGDDDIWVGDAKAKKKPAAKKRKSTVNEDEAETEAKKPKPKIRKTKQIETLVITDSEDELAGPGGDPDSLGTIQVAGTADAFPLPPLEAAKNMTVKLSSNAEEASADELGIIAVDSFSVQPDIVEESYPTVAQNKLSTRSGAESELAVLDDIPKAKTKKQTAVQRRKSRKDESEEEDWKGDPEPAKKKKAPRVTKKAAAKAAKEEKEKRLSEEMIKDSDNEGPVAEPEPELKPEPVKKKELKLSKAAAAKKAKKEAEAKAEAEETASEEDVKENTPPAPEAKPEPQTPSKKLAEKEKAKKTPHSPINKGPVKFRVGLSRRAHIEPLLKIIRK